MFVVGPESAGAQPGPVCYRKGSPTCLFCSQMQWHKDSVFHVKNYARIMCTSLDYACIMRNKNNAKDY